MLGQWPGDRTRVWELCTQLSPVGTDMAFQSCCQEESYTGFHIFLVSLEKIEDMKITVPIKTSSNSCVLFYLSEYGKVKNFLLKEPNLF